MSVVILREPKDLGEPWHRHPTQILRRWLRMTTWYGPHKVITYSFYVYMENDQAYANGPRDLVSLNQKLSFGEC